MKLSFNVELMNFRKFDPTDSAPRIHIYFPLYAKVNIFHMKFFSHRGNFAFQVVLALNTRRYIENIKLLARFHELS